MQSRLAESKLALIKSVGGLIRSGALLFLLGLIPYTLYAGYQLYRALYPLAGMQTGPLAYPGARLIACLLLLYALWRLRQAGLRLRNLKRPET